VPEYTTDGSPPTDEPVFLEVEQCRETIPRRELDRTIFDRCVQSATTIGGPKLTGWDSEGSPVYMQKWMCVRGHWYMVEVRT
jgi:hypothetical protein